VIGGHNIFGTYLEPVMLIPEQAKEHWAFLHAEQNHSLEIGLMVASVVIMAISSGAALVLYRNGPAPVLASWKKSFIGVYETLFNKYWVDDLYHKVFVKPLRDMSEFLWSFVDVNIIDGLVNGAGELVKVASGATSFKMSGSVHRHAMVFTLGLVGLLAILVFV
jgi:NADH-quinone oxidoreductase subunit L